MRTPPQRRVGVLINLAGPYGRFVLEGILQYARGAWMIFTRPMPALSQSALFENWDIDGLIAQLPVRQHQERLAKRTRVPVVNVTTTLPAAAVPTVTSDHESIVKLGLEDFAGRGFRQVAYAGASQNPLAAYSRIRGDAFARFAAEHGIACYRHDVQPESANTVEHGPRQDLVEWVRGLPKPVGILAASDESAWDVLQACAIAGITVPDEAAVMGIDNDDLIVRLTTPPLSSIDINAERVGFEAAKLLDSLLMGKRPPEGPVLVPPLGLVTRQSTDVLAVEDEDVVAARPVHPRAPRAGDQRAGRARPGAGVAALAVPEVPGGDGPLAGAGDPAGAHRAGQAAAGDDRLAGVAHRLGVRVRRGDALRHRLPPLHRADADAVPRPAQHQDPRRPPTRSPSPRRRRPCARVARRSRSGAGAWRVSIRG